MPNEPKDLNQNLDDFLNGLDCTDGECVVRENGEIVRKVNDKIIIEDANGKKRQLLREITNERN